MTARNTGRKKFIDSDFIWLMEAFKLKNVPKSGKSPQFSRRILTFLNLGII